MTFLFLFTITCSMTSMILAALSAGVGSSFSIVYEPQVKQDAWATTPYWDTYINEMNLYNTSYLFEFLYYDGIAPGATLIFDFWDNEGKDNIGWGFSFNETTLHTSYYGQEFSADFSDYGFDYYYLGAEEEHAVEGCDTSVLSELDHSMPVVITMYYGQVVLVLCDQWVNVEIYNASAYNNVFNSFEWRQIVFGNLRFRGDLSGLFTHLQLPFFDYGCLQYYYYSGERRENPDFTVNNAVLDGSHIDILDAGNMAVDENFYLETTYSSQFDKPIIVTSNPDYSWTIEGEEFVETNGMVNSSSYYFMPTTVDFPSLREVRIEFYYGGSPVNYWLQETPVCVGWTSPGVYEDDALGLLVNNWNGSISDEAIVLSAPKFIADSDYGIAARFCAVQNSLSRDDKMTIYFVRSADAHVYLISHRPFIDIVE